MAGCVAGGLARRGGDAGRRNLLTSKSGLRRPSKIRSAAMKRRGGLDEQLADFAERAACRLRTQITGATSSTQRGCLIVNPCELPATVRDPARVRSFGIRRARVDDVPAMGFAWVGAPAERVTPRPAGRGAERDWFGLRPAQPAKKPPPLAEENVLRNEFFEVHFDPHTGAIRSISDYHSRDPRLAQQIALRLPRGGEPGGEATTRSWPPTRLP